VNVVRASVPQPDPAATFEAEYGAIIQALTRATSDAMGGRVDSLLRKVAATDRELAFAILRYSNAVLEFSASHWDRYIGMFEAVAEVNLFALGVTRL